MKRRNFLKKAIVGVSAVAMGSSVAKANESPVAEYPLPASKLREMIIFIENWNMTKYEMGYHASIQEMDDAINNDITQFLEAKRKKVSRGN